MAILTPQAIPIPWRDVTLPEKLTIAVMYDDGVVKPQPPLARALRETVDKLKAAGHEVIEWEPIDHDQAQTVIARMFVADGARTMAETIKKGGDPWMPGPSAHPHWQADFAGMPFYQAAAESATADLSTSDMWKLHLERSAFANRYMQRWTDTKSRTKSGRPVDAILCPAVAGVAFRHDAFAYGTFDGRTSRWRDRADRSQWATLCGRMSWLPADDAVLGESHRLSRRRLPGHARRQGDRSRRHLIPASQRGRPQGPRRLCALRKRPR